ncbi:hypothetical protein GCM10010402_82050 [Actinomadura luteofluorescens]
MRAAPSTSSCRTCTCGSTPTAASSPPTAECGVAGAVPAFVRGQPRVLPGDPHQRRLARIQGGHRPRLRPRHLLFLDAETAREAAPLVEPVRAGEADMPIAVFARP